MTRTFLIEFLANVLRTLLESNSCTEFSDFELQGIVITLMENPSSITLDDIRHLRNRINPSLTVTLNPKWGPDFLNALRHQINTQVHLGHVEISERILGLREAKDFIQFVRAMHEAWQAKQDS